MTTVPKASELPRSYVPGEHEEAISASWEAAGVFHAEPQGSGDAEGREPYCILIPPPNVTAPLHLGHAFNNSLQDVLVRYHRMRGFNVLWMPGTDHAGIATQTAVEKRLLAEGQKRREMGREAFVARVQAWKDEYEATITRQLKAMGASCDWDRQRFTMDAMCAEAVRTAFFRFFRDGLIYRGKRLVNWDPVTRTALADDEVEMREVDGHFWYLKYPIVDDAGNETGETVTVATTRPETMLGDTAVAVNPSDPERAPLIGKTVRLPIVGRLVPIIGDDYVVRCDPESDDPKARYASGFLKVTPAHDPNDWLIGQRHGLRVVNIMAPDASISDTDGWDDCPEEGRAFVGLSREEARKRIAAWFETHGLLEETRSYRHSVGHSYRSHVPVEPYLSDQWYLRVTDDRLVGNAQRALDAEQFEGAAAPRADGSGTVNDGDGDGGLTFHPARYARTYQAWHDNLRDWCISRQLWWGHRIPVWSSLWGPDSAAGTGAEPGVHAAADARLAAIEERLSAWESEGRIARQVHDLDEGRVVFVCVQGEDDREVTDALAGAGLGQDPDVLDTWFSSGLWPLSTMGWPAPETHPETSGLLETFNPSTVLCTAREIITLWVSRMVMFNRYLRGGTLPFRHVYVHAMIQDGHGQKMSKSLGNGVDPRDIIATHGADALRFVLVRIATSTQDVRLPVDTVCPACGQAFHPPEVTSASGYRVTAPHLACPKCKHKLVSPYGVASGEASATEEEPLAGNTSTQFDLGRNFANKLWNASRFALATLEDEPEGGPQGEPQAEPLGDPELALDDLAIVDRWIINRLHATLHAVEDALAAYQFNVYADALYDFVWRDFCDWYLEAIKPTVRASAAQRQVLRTILNAAIRLLHPIIPFVTEALWSRVQRSGPAGLDGITLPGAEFVAVAEWPSVACRVHDAEASETFERAQALVTAIRGLRAQHQVPRQKKIGLQAPPAVCELVARAGGVVETLAVLGSIENCDAARPAGTIPLAFEGDELHLAGLVEAVDVASERPRLAKLVEEKRRAVDGYRRKLGNRGYVDNAPPAVVEETRERMTQSEADLVAAERALAALDGASS